MTPNIGNMEVPAVAAIEGGAKGIAAINTIKSITNINLDFMTAMPVVNGKSSISGYSGASCEAHRPSFHCTNEKSPAAEGYSNERHRRY